MLATASLLLAGALVFATGAWLAAQPWQARHWRRDAEAGHWTAASLYEGHMGEPPAWADAFVPPPPPRAVRHARAYRLAGAALMAAGAAFLYNQLPLKD